MRMGDIPFSHCASQKGVCFPSPTVMTVEAKKSTRSVLSRIFSRFFHGQSTASQLYHIQRNLRALLCLSRSFIPKPPSFLGLMHFFHRTRQCPPCNLSGSSPLHRKLRLKRDIPNCPLRQFVDRKKVSWDGSKDRFD
jgi:hypothetical protein